MLHLLLIVALLLGFQPDTDEERHRARDLGVEIGILPPGPLNSITDVEGVRVGHATVIEGENVRTGVTAVLPHGDNVFRDRVPAAIYVANGFGKLVGQSQVQELGELETPVLLTCTLCVWEAAGAMVDSLLERGDMQNVRSVNPVVGETNDGFLNDIRSRPISADHVREALREASTGPVAEGNVGAGTGTRSFGWKSGIGTSSRALPGQMGDYTVGVLVQSNFGGVLSIDGAPVGEELEQHAFRESLGSDGDGSIMIVVATDAPLDARQLNRLAKRAVTGLARTGASMTHGSGDYVIAFSTDAESERISDGNLSPLFQGVAEATEEAIINSLFMAEGMSGDQGNIDALPLDTTMDILREYNVIE